MVVLCIFTNLKNALLDRRSKEERKRKVTRGQVELGSNPIILGPGVEERFLPLLFVDGLALGPTG